MQIKVRGLAKSFGMRTWGGAVGIEVHQPLVLWLDNMPGSLTPIIADMIDDWIRDYGPDEVVRGIQADVAANNRRPNYVNGVLKRRAAGEDKPRSNGTGTPRKSTQEQDEEMARMRADVKRAKQGIATAERLGFAPLSHDVAMLERAKQAGLL